MRGCVIRGQLMRECVKCMEVNNERVCYKCISG